MSPWLRRKLIPITKAIGRITAPWSVKRVDGSDYEDILQLMRPGDVFVSRVYGHLSNKFIPGYWKHSAILGPDPGKPVVIEAIGNGVKTTNLVTFLTTKDEVVLLRPTFCSQGPAAEAAKYALSVVGSEYDFEFSIGNKAFYCAELVYVSYTKVAPQLGFEPRPRLGVITVTADDFYNAKEWWTVVFDSRNNNS